MFIPVEVKALADFKIWVRFTDGIEGEVSLKHLAGKGVFVLWNDYEYFRKVSIDQESHAVAWTKDIDICPDALYFEIIKKNPEDFFSLKQNQVVNA